MDGPTDINFGKPVFFDDPWRYFNAMLDDIQAARKEIYIETYKYGNGNIGTRFRDLLTQKAKEGVKVRILIDSWGAQVSNSFFKELIASGGEVRFFKKIIFFWDFFTKNHRRNHRKLLLIDQHISYIGSANIAGNSLNWCESMLRLENPDLNKQLGRIFHQDWKMFQKYSFKKKYLTRIIRVDEFEILRDVPSITRQRIKRRYEFMIRNAQHRVLIETPYFLPGFILRKTMSDAVKRGVDVTVIIPENSDVRLVDLIRARYLGMLHKNGVKFRLFHTSNLHAKLLLIDGELFSIGSPNFDYRSFRYQHEIAIMGKNSIITDQIKTHISNCLQNSKPFDFEEWQRRPFIQKFIEWMFLPFRHLL